MASSNQPSRTTGLGGGKFAFGRVLDQTGRCQKNLKKSDLFMDRVSPCIKQATCNMNTCCSQYPCLKTLYAQRAPIQDLVGPIPNFPPHRGLGGENTKRPLFLLRRIHRGLGGENSRFEPFGTKPRPPRAYSGPEGGWNNFQT